MLTLTTLLIHYQEIVDTLQSFGINEIYLFKDVVEHDLNILIIEYNSEKRPHPFYTFPISQALTDLLECTVFVEENCQMNIKFLETLNSTNSIKIKLGQDLDQDEFLRQLETIFGKNWVFKKRDVEASEFTHIEDKISFTPSEHTSNYDTDNNGWSSDDMSIYTQEPPLLDNVCPINSTHFFNSSIAADWNPSRQEEAYSNNKIHPVLSSNQSSHPLQNSKCSSEAQQDNGFVQRQSPKAR